MQLIEDYIELEKLRYDDRLEVHVSSAVLNENKVPPLIFLSLVENAFKHGAGEDSGSPKIWITLQSEATQVVFSVINTCADTVEIQVKESIGLININKQLQLLYGEMYSLTTGKENGLFNVTLVLQNKISDED
jgi:sensor histidine kinase YesM